MRLTCPICGLEVDVPDDVISGEVIEHDCGAVLEVVMEGPSTVLRPLDGVQEDWGE